MSKCKFTNFYVYVFLEAAISGTNAIEIEVENSIKCWLKHAPKRLGNKK